MKPPKIKPMLTRMIGHVPFRTTITQSDSKKGLMVATATFNGTKLVGVGPTTRQATLAVRKQIDDAVSHSKADLR